MPVPSVKLCCCLLVGLPCFRQVLSQSPSDTAELNDKETHVELPVSTFRLCFQVVWLHTVLSGFQTASLLEGKEDFSWVTRVTASGPEDLPADLAVLSLTLQLSLPPEVHCSKCVGEISLFFILCCCAMWDRRLFPLGEVRKQSTAAALPSALKRAEICQERATSRDSHLSLKPCFPQCSMHIWWDRCSPFVIISWVQLPYLKPLHCCWIRPWLYLCFYSGQEQGLGEGGGYRANLQDVGPVCSSSPVWHRQLQS